MKTAGALVMPASTYLWGQSRLSEGRLCPVIRKAKP
jgi:hypothetical protein